MKTPRAFAWLVSLVTLLPLGHAAAPPAARGPAEPGGLSSASAAAGPHHRVVRVQPQDVGPGAGPETGVDSYVELATGLNRFDADAQEWVPARVQFELTADGHVIARQTQHQVILSPTLDTEGAVDFLTPDGVRLRSTPLGLGALDTATGRSFLLAEVQASAPVLVSASEVLYLNAFDGVQVDLRYRLGRDRFEQDLILREPIAPEWLEELGLNPATTRVFVMTEFFDPPQPRQDAGPIRGRRTGRDLADARLNFGQMAIGEGRAFGLARRAEAAELEEEGAPVGKAWEVLDGRQFLIESVEYLDLVPLLETLPGAGQAKASERTPRAVRTAAVPRRLGGVREARAAAPRFEEGRMVLPLGQRVAAAPAPAPAQLARLIERPGVVVDYVLTLSTGQANYTFRADTTYLINGLVMLSGSTATFEGGTVLKYAAGVGAKVAVDSATRLVWRGGFHKPVIFTAKDDHGIGAKIGSATSISGYYATTALELTYNATYGPINLGWLRVAHAQNGIRVIGGGGHAFRHLQVVNCDKGIVTSGTTSYAVRNALFAGVNKALSGASTVTAEHLTVNGGALRDASQPAVTLKNSLLAGVSDVGTNYGTDSQVLPTSAGVFQARLQGAHYLAAGSPYRNWPAALISIDSGLLADLRKLTTYPPVISGGDFTASTTLSPQAQRDTDTLDLGYHYPPVDYLMDSRTVSTGCTLLLTNGVSVAAYGTRLVNLSGTGKLVSEGMPTLLNRIGYAGAVQEQPTTNTVPGLLVNGYNLDLRFTGLTLAGGRSLVPDAALTGTIRLRDCQVAGWCWSLYNWYQWGFSPAVVLQNNLLERCYFSFEQGYVQTPGAGRLRSCRRGGNGAITGAASLSIRCTYRGRTNRRRRNRPGS